MDPKALLDALSVPFPDRAIEQRQGAGGRMLDYVATETVIRRLNDAVGVWDFRITDKLVTQGELLVVWGELTIPGLGTRAGTGVQQLRGGEDMWKGAASDCLKKCATLFNVGIDLYGPDLEAGEMPNENKVPARTRTTSQNTIPASNGNEPITGWTQFWDRVEAMGLPRDGKAFIAMTGINLGSDPALALEKAQAWAHDNPIQQAVVK